MTGYAHAVGDGQLLELHDEGRICSRVADEPQPRVDAVPNRGGKGPQDRSDSFFWSQLAEYREHDARFRDTEIGTRLLSLASARLERRLPERNGADDGVRERRPQSIC